MFLKERYFTDLKKMRNFSEKNSSCLDENILGVDTAAFLGQDVDDLGGVFEKPLLRHLGGSGANGR